MRFFNFKGIEKGPALYLALFSLFVLALNVFAAVTVVNRQEEEIRRIEEGLISLKHPGLARYLPLPGKTALIFPPAITPRKQWTRRSFPAIRYRSRLRGVTGILKSSYTGLRPQ